jgi:hypothetical protein
VSGGDQFVDPLVTDITEDKWVYAAPSNVHGEGLFAATDIPTNTVFSYYGGRRVSFPEFNATVRPRDPTYWYGISGAGQVVYLPESDGRDTGVYRATLGHKINHSFESWNCMFHVMDHPRFGTIPAARTTVRVDKDRELLCHYQWEYHEGGPWYQVRVFFNQVTKVAIRVYVSSHYRSRFIWSLENYINLLQL